MSRYYKILPLLIMFAGLVAGCSSENPEAGVCNSCHGYPPDGSPHQSVAPIPVNHTLVSNLTSFLAAHDDCSTCHGVKDDGTGKPLPTGNYVVDVDHQDGNINLNLDTQYNINTFGCDAAGCHTGNAPYRLTDSGLPVVLDSYGIGSGACDTCHGYPPTPSTGHATGATPVDHTEFSATGVVNNHNECNVCHGYSLANGPTLNASNGGDDYDLGFHRDGSIDMNGWATDSGQDTQYNITNFGCDIACHNPSNDVDHQLPNSSGFPVRLGRYGGSCDTCHGYPPTPSTLHASAATPVDHTEFSPTGIIDNHSECNTCHGYSLANGPTLNASNGGDNYDLAFHQDGNIEMNGWATDSGQDTQYNVTNFGCDIACHNPSNDPNHQLPTSSGLTVQFGRYGGACDTCHGYPPDGTDAQSAPGVAPGSGVDHSTPTIVGSHSECNVCHGYSQTNGPTDNTANGGDAYLATYHNDGSIDMNGVSPPTDNGQSAEYQVTTWDCTAACHVPYQMSDSGLTVRLGEYGGGACLDCHDGTGAAGSATTITDGSPHTTQILGLTCEECHGSHGGGTIEIPNNATVGINYTANGEAGIALGAAGTAPGATEAEICWNCHDSVVVNVSEWGINTDTNAGGANYDFGSLTQSNWVGANWTSANFSYKTAGIQSTHSVSGSAAGPGMDAVADIRCSYCHDVHDLNTLGSDSSSGKPYLRGTWMGNPYREDGAPRNTNTYTSITVFGEVPRGGNAHNELGGYQIDQNNGNPTNGWTLSNSAGICTVCHGSDVNNMNEFGSAAADWVGTNGHSNAVIGGTGSNAANIFSNNDRNPNGVTTGRNGGNPSMAYVSSQDRGYGFRSVGGADSEDEGYDLTPWMDGSLGPDSNSRPYGFQLYDWGASVDAGSTDPLYHKFSCSKCHNPHASRLPRLMITNCLDTNHNTWDTKAGVQMIPPTGTSDLGGTDSVGADNGNLPFSNSTSAQNCHRVADPQYGNSTGAGWNNVTPWVEF